MPRAALAQDSEVADPRKSTRERIRTSDTRFRKAVLYPLSYAGAHDLGGRLGDDGSSGERERRLPQ